MNRYRYGGPPSGVTIGDREVLLHPGAVVELDPAHPYTATLLALGHLTGEPAPAAAPAPARRAAKTEDPA